MKNPVVGACLFQKTQERRHVGLNHLYYKLLDGDPKSPFVIPPSIPGFPGSPQVEKKHTRTTPRHE